MKGWAATSGESCQGCFKGAEVLGGPLGSPIDRPLCSRRGGTSWCKASGGQRRSPLRSGGGGRRGGRPEEVAGPELAPCLAQGLVHPPLVPRFPSEPVLRAGTFLFQLFWSLVTCGPEGQRRISVFFRSGTHTLVIEIILVPGSQVYFPCVSRGVALHSCYYILALLGCWLGGVHLPLGRTADSLKNSSTVLWCLHP